jgi:tetratricopeptide (TPR) repeat protein
MENESPPPSLFDDLLDRSLRGEEIDVEQVLAAHPELPDDERHQLRILCGRTAAPSRQAAPANPPANLPPNAFLPVTQVGGHRLVRRIGAGAMGAVFLAEDAKLGRQVAIKILGPDILGTGERADRFLREVRAAARLRHPHIVTVHSAGEQDGLRYMVMEYIPGSSLHEVVADAASRGSQPPAADVLSWGTEIASALRAAHEQGIVHRDVKPSNIRIASDGRAMLLDFGLAREASDATLTETGSFRGSPQYASPEQVESGRHAIDARTDVYSLGATLYEVLTGVAPFRGETREQLFHNILTRDPVPPRRLEPSIPRDLETVILATLEKDPERRPQSAAALAADLEAVRDGRPVSVRPPSRAGRVARWAKRHPARAGLALALLIGLPAIAALGGFVLASLPKLELVSEQEHAARLETMLEDAFLEYGEGDLAVARSRFEEAVRWDPKSEEALAGLALCQKDAAATLAFLDALPAETQTRSWCGRIRAHSLSEPGQEDEAKALAARLETSKTAIDSFVSGEICLNRFHYGSREDAAKAFFRLRQAVWSKSPAMALYHFELGHAAWHANRQDEARQIAISIERLWPETPVRTFAIARTLLGANPQAAFDALDKAASQPPASFAARQLITERLAESGRSGAALDHALALARDTVARDPSRARSYVSLGMVQGHIPDLPAATEAFHDAIRLNPNLALAHQKLAAALELSQEHERAVAPAREGVRLDPKDPWAWNVLGIVLASLHEEEEASRDFEEAMKLFPDNAEFLCNSGRELVRLGDFDAGLERLRRGHELGSKMPAWRYPSANWVARAEGLAALAKRLESVERGQGRRPTADELVDFAEKVCRPRKRFAQASSLYARAFDEEPALKAQRSPAYLREAAGAAVSAGLGKGADAPAGAAERARLRELARGWLEEEIGAAEETVRDDATRRGSEAEIVQTWTADPAFAAMRQAGDAGAAGIPAQELAGWQLLWKRCAALLDSPDRVEAPVSRPASAPVPVTK